MELRNKTIVLTGGTSGIGRQLVDQLSHANQLIVLGRDSEKLDALKEQYPSVIAYQVDLSNTKEVYRLASLIGKHHPQIDVLINNAAVQFAPYFNDKHFNFSTVQYEIDTNLTAVCALIHGLLPSLMSASSSKIINVNSALSLVPKASSAVYCATKGALNILSQSLRYQFEGSPIKVQQVFMPLVETQMTAGRGSNKISATLAASKMIEGIEQKDKDFDIGATRVLRVLFAIAPFAARKLLKGS
ncbi:SDR family oxidoreductase [Enterovibrio coralii]|uniref:Short-chain dehydrogenase n=1 Tax=Enterovibrio coralii TaxID=294935 RepID=A0A135IE08_9GAMM|nr:SDR family NAD(P)-dependent oxidoreductase [Enterovibrio coralii]KXF83584.1 short-chain dehydrogenase [Enterovibrio coralii]